MIRFLPKTWLRALLLTAMATWLTACASAPVQEMSDARQALDAALQAGAAQRAPRQTKAAQTALAEAERSLKRHEFSRARTSAHEARTQAIEAQRIAQSTATPAP